MARPRTKARKSYDELLEENAEKNPEAYGGSPGAGTGAQGAPGGATGRGDGGAVPLYAGDGPLAQEILDSLQKTKPESEQMAS